LNLWKLGVGLHPEIIFGLKTGAETASWEKKL